jgi:hypothetical protein
MKRRRKLAVPFVMTIAAACGGQIDGVPDRGSTVEDQKEPGEKCPGALPAVGTSCSGERVFCSTYRCDPRTGPSGASRQCVAGKWEAVFESCNPPPVECPVEIPLPGEPCIGVWGGCSHRCSDGRTQLSTCKNGTWSVTSACNQVVDAGRDVSEPLDAGGGGG